MVYHGLNKLRLLLPFLLFCPPSSLAELAAELAGWNRQTDGHRGETSGVPSNHGTRVGRSDHRFRSSIEGMSDRCPFVAVS